jgi:hypothetical protein
MKRLLGIRNFLYLVSKILFIVLFIYKVFEVKNVECLVILSLLSKARQDMNVT